MKFNLLKLLFLWLLVFTWIFFRAYLSLFKQNSSEGSIDSFSEICNLCLLYIYFDLHCFFRLLYLASLRIKMKWFQSGFIPVLNKWWENSFKVVLVEALDHHAYQILYDASLGAVRWVCVLIIYICVCVYLLFLWNKSAHVIPLFIYFFCISISVYFVTHAKNQQL